MSKISDVTKLVDGIENKIPVVNQELEKVNSSLSIVKDVIVKIEETDTCVKDCAKAIKALAAGGKMLSSVPFVGKIIGTLSSVLNDIAISLNGITGMLDKIKKSAKVLEKSVGTAQNGTGVIMDINKDMMLYLPKIAKSVSVIDYTLEIAAIISDTTPDGSELRKRLDNLNSNLEDMVSKAEIPVKEIERIYNELKAVLDNIISECQRVKDKTECISKVINNVKKVSEILSPIGNAINKVLDAIAPVRWVLNAAACLINKILDPIISAILKATGLQKLIDDAENKILDLLGFNDIIESIENALGNLKIVDEIDQMVNFKENVRKMVEQTNESLEMFSTSANGKFGVDFKVLLGSLFNAEFDFTKPFVIPEWPEQPTFECNTIAAVSKSRKRTVRFDWNKWLERKGQAYQIYIPIYTKEEFAIKEYNEMKVLADKISQGFAEMAELHDRLDGKINVLKMTTDLPESFKIEINSFAVYMAFIARLLESVAKLPIFENEKGKIVSIQKWLNGQGDECREIVSEIDRMKSAAEKYQEYMACITATINKEEISRFIIAVNEYAENLKTLMEGFGLATEHNPDEKSISELQEIKKHIRDNTKSLLDEMSRILEMTESVNQKYRSTYTAVSDILENYSSISPEGYLLPEETVNNIEKAADILSKLTGIFEPLDAIYDVLKTKDCKEADGNMAGKLAKNQISEFCEKTINSVRIDTVWEILDKLSPISNLRISLRKLTNELNTDYNILEDIKTDIEVFYCIIDNGMKYEVDKESFTNKFLDDNDVKKLTEISKYIVEH